MIPYKHFKLAILFVIASLVMAAATTRAATPNVEVGWTLPTIDSQGYPIPTTLNGVTNAITNIYVYQGTTAQNMTQVAQVAAPAKSWTTTLAAGHYCFSVVIQNAIGISGFAPPVCANVTATTVTVVQAPAAPTGFNAQ